MMRWILLLLCLLTGTASAAGARRIALLVGANDGGSDRVRLRYAIDDARALEAVLHELGGIAPGDLTALAEPTRAELVEALRGMAQTVSALPDRVEFVFYYSGHSDEKGLLLGGERLGYRELRTLIGRLPATVRIAIVDACASGALTRTKGGVRRAPFLLDESNAVAGSAILTSASADEAAQESDRIKGSFFTHALLSGLRGAADRSGDGRITLTEAYQFAYAETLARTETTRLGAQHPNYDLQLSGRGEVVLTDVRSTAAGMIFAPDLAGRFAVRAADGQLIAELSKSAGRPLELGLPAGRYQIIHQQTGRAARAEIEVAAGQRTRLDRGRFGEIETEVNRARGGTPAQVDHWDLNLVGSGEALDGTEIGLINHRSRWVNGAQIALIGNMASALDGSQIGIVFNRVGGDVDGAQVSAAVNSADGLVDGAQVSAAVNLAGRLDGAQVSAALNLTEAMNGAQVSAGVNIAESVDGAQIAAGLNLADAIDGVQIGVINIGGSVNGAQIGVINIAERMDGAPIGLLNIIGDGVHALEVWSSDQDRSAIGLRLGSRHFQTVLAVGSDDGERFRPGAGFSGRMRLPARFDLTLDAMAWAPRFTTDEPVEVDDITDLRYGARLLLGWRLGIFRVFGGPVARLDYETQTRASADGTTRVDSDVFRVSPGFAFGVSIF